MIERHSKFNGMLSCMDVYTKIDTIEVNLNDNIPNLNQQAIKECETSTWYKPHFLST